MRIRKNIIVVALCLYCLSFFLIPSTTFATASNEDASYTVKYYLEYPNAEKRLLRQNDGIHHGEKLETLFHLDTFDAELLDNDEYIGVMLEEGWEFEYWQKENEDEEYVCGEITEDLVLYAKIKKQVLDVCFYINDYINMTVPIEYGKTIPTENIPSFSNYCINLIGWYADKGLSCELNFDNESPSINSNTIFYGKIDTPTHTITLHYLNDILIKEFPHYAWLTQDSLPIKDEEGYNFVGWLINEGLYLEEILLVDDLELHAEYEIIQYSVIFKGLNGNTLLEIKVDYGTSVDTPNSDIFLEEGFVLDYLEGSYDNITSDTIIYAKYLPIRYLDADGNILENNLPPIIEGMEFTGWDSKMSDGYCYYMPIYTPLNITDNPSQIENISQNKDDNEDTISTNIPATQSVHNDNQSRSSSHLDSKMRQLCYYTIIISLFSLLLTMSKKHILKKRMF